jgi:hypothetical protein
MAKVNPPSVKALSVCPPAYKHDERDGERERNGYRYDDGSAHALKEQQDDKRNKDERLHNLLLQAVVGVANECGLVENGLHLHAGRQILQAANDLLYGIDDFQGVAARDAQHIQIHGVVPIHCHGLRFRRSAVFDASHVTNEYWLAATKLHHGLADVAHLLGDSVGVHVGVEG